jgi:hypothetical protein
LKESERQELKR